MRNIPLVPVPSQKLAVTLGSQACIVKVYQKSTGLFLDLYIGETLIIGGVICQNANRIVRDAYLGFVGDLAFFDTQGDQFGAPEDPIYTGLGGRWVLNYLELGE